MDVVSRTRECFRFSPLHSSRYTTGPTIVRRFRSCFDVVSFGTLDNSKWGVGSGVGRFTVCNCRISFFR